MQVSDTIYVKGFPLEDISPSAPKKAKGIPGMNRGVLDWYMCAIWLGGGYVTSLCL